MSRTSANPISANDLLHRAALLLAHDGHARQHERDQQEDDGEDARHVEVAALEVVVEPGARLQFHRARLRGAGHRPRVACGEQVARVGLRDPRRVVEHHRGRVRVGAVDEPLHGGRAPGRHVGAEPPVHLDHGADRAAVPQRAHVLVARDVGHQVEVARPGEARRQLPARDAVVEVVDRRAHVPHVGGDRVAEDQRLDDRHQEDDAAHPGIAEDLDELLDEHVADALEHGYSSDFLNFTIASSVTTAPNTVSRPASNASRSRPMPVM